MGPKTPFASTACAVMVSGFPRVPAATGWCVSCGGSPSSGTIGSAGATGWTAAAGADDFFLRFFDVFLLPFFLPLFVLFFFAGFAGGFALASGWDRGAASDWAIAAAAKHKLAAAITNSLRRCIRFVPEKVESTLPGNRGRSIKAHRVCGAAKREDRGGPATAAPDVWARSPRLPPRRPRRR